MYLDRKKQDVGGEFTHEWKENSLKAYEVMLPQGENLGKMIVLPDFFFFLGQHPWRMEIPRLGVEWELQRQPTPQPQQHRI